MARVTKTTNESITINGVYATPVDLNTLMKLGKFKIKLGDNRPTGIDFGIDALISISKQENCIIQSVIILCGNNAGKTFTRSSFTEGATWTEYVSANAPNDIKLDKNFDNFATRNPLKDGDVFVLWSGEDSFKINAASLREFMTGEHFKGYVDRLSDLEKLGGRKGDYAIVGDTKSFWIYDDIWQDASRVTSVNSKTGDVVINPGDVFGPNSPLASNTFIDGINTIISSLNNANFLTYYYSGYTIEGNVQIIPETPVNDRIFLILGGIILKQDNDFIISNENEITIDERILIKEDMIIHCFRIHKFDLPLFVEKTDPPLIIPEDDDDVIAAVNPSEDDCLPPNVEAPIIPPSLQPTIPQEIIPSGNPCGCKPRKRK